MLFLIFFSNFFFAKSNSNRLRNAHANFGEPMLCGCGDMFELGINEGKLIKGVFFDIFLYFFLNLLQLRYEIQKVWQITQGLWLCNGR